MSERARLLLSALTLACTFAGIIYMLVTRSEAVRQWINPEGPGGRWRILAYLIVSIFGGPAILAFVMTHPSLNFLR